MGLDDKENENQVKTSAQITMRNTARRRPKMKKAPPPPCVAGEKTNGTISNLSTHEIMANHPGDDCAINELLEGNMDLEVVLPDLKIVRMTVERRIPMMDLLVQVTKTNKISPGGHFISLSPNNKDSLHYKPNTPIGSLDTNTVYIMSKSAMNDQPATKMLRSQSQPFEKTFRLQVNLPKKQLMVVRVSPKMTLAEIKKMICTEKKLEYSQYYLVHPSQPSFLIDLNYSLSEYGCTEVSVVNKSTMNSSISSSTSDLIGYPNSTSEEEKKKKKLLNIFKRKSKSVNNMMIAGEAFKETVSNRGISPARSDICDTHSLRIKRQSTKKRAPPPPPPPPFQPQTHLTTEVEVATKANSSSEPVSGTVGSTTIITTMVSHSRQSSDSSGYHEASVLSDSPDNLSPETSGGSGSSGIHSTDNTEQENQKVAVPKCNSRLKSRDKPNFSSVAHSMLILNTNKKRKAPPPPPSQPNVSKETLKSNIEINSVDPEKKIIPASINENDDHVKAEMQPATIEIVNNSSNDQDQAEITENSVSPIKDTDPDFCISPSENGIDSVPSEQTDASPFSSPTNSLPSHNDSFTELETPDTSTKNHRHTEEETGEVIHFLEKGEISKSSIIQELISDFIPPPLEFSTPSTPTECINTNEKKPEPIPRTNINRDDSFKTKIFPTPHPRLTLQNSSESNKSCRRSLNFSDELSEQKTVEQDKNVEHLHEINSDEDKVSKEDTKTTINFSDEIPINPIKKDDDDDDKELIPNSIGETTEEAIEISDSEWDFNIPEPPSPFRNNRESNTLESELKQDEIHLLTENKNSTEKVIEYNTLKEITETPISGYSECLQEKLDDDLIDNCPPSLPESMPPRDKCFSVGSISSDIPPPLPISDPPESREKSYSFCSTSSDISFPEFDPSERELDLNSVNKELKAISKDKTNDSKTLDNDQFVGISRIDITNQESISSQTYIVVPQPKRRPHLENFTIGSYKNGKANDSLSFTSPLTDDKPSNLIQTNSFPKEDSKVNKPNYNFTIMPFKSRNSYNEKEIDQNSDLDEVLIQDEAMKIEAITNKNDVLFKSKEKEDDTKIERQLEEEYQKLQNQLLAWQQQLVKNQTLLQEKRIVPEMSVPDLSPLCTQSKVEEKSIVEQKSQTLPRPKSNVNKEQVEQIHSSTVEYYSQPKLQILKNVTIGSWERKPKITVRSIAEVKPKFQNVNGSQVNNNAIIKGKKFNALLEDSEKDKVSQISAKFDIKSSNNKTAETNKTESLDNAPPAVILAQIRKEMKANAKYPAGTVINTEPKKGISVSKTYIRPKSQIIYSHYSSVSDDRISDLTKSSSQDPIKPNGNITRPVVVATIKNKPALDKDIINGNKKTISLPVSTSIPIPPPPLPPVVPINKNNSKFQSVSHQLKVSKTKPISDPREELMIEIRKFGGRKALRKVPLNQAGWHLKVFGTLSSSSV